MIGFESIKHLGLLGNQMFQYAALRGIAYNRGFDYCLPHSKPDQYFRKAKFLQKKAPDAQLSERCWDLQLYYPFYLTARQLKIKGLTVYERQFEFDEILFNNCPDSVNLCGFFQSPKYFKNIEKEIRREFRFRDEIINTATTVIPHDAVAMHIRRGTNSIFHPELSMSFYERALEHFRKRPVVIFTNDPSWVKKQPLFNSDRFTISKDQTNFADMYLMTQCTGHIIANSSYSWWGAWLANSEKVVAPKHWYNGFLKIKKQTDLYPKEWITLPNEGKNSKLI